MGSHGPKKKLLRDGNGALSALSNHQIEDYYKGCEKFGGCPANDEVSKNTIDPKKFYIINMAPRASGGSHWVLLFEDMYFDSFGFQPTLAVKPFVRVWNNTTYQDFHSSACGFYCIFVADNILAGRFPTDKLDDNPDDDNEQVLHQYFAGRSIGNGFFSNVVKKIKDRIVPNKGAPKNLQTFLDDKGRQNISKIEIARKPVNSFASKALDLVSLGRFSKKRKELGYTDVFHNYLLVTLKDGKTYRIEKNERVSATPADASDFVESRSNVPLKGDVTVKQLVDNASKDNPSLWRYRAGSDNCQAFTKDVLTKNNLTPDVNPPMQDAAKLIDTLPLRSTIPNLITDAASRVDQLITGGQIASDLTKWY